MGGVGTAGAGGGGPGAVASMNNKMMYMQYNQLNTIEEDKHETQNSNYYRDGGESERDDSKVHLNQLASSKILGDISHDEKPSPTRKEPEYLFNKNQEGIQNGEIDEKNEEF